VGGIFALIKEQANASAKARDDLQKAKANDKPSGGCLKQTSGTSTTPNRQRKPTGWEGRRLRVGARRLPGQPVQGQEEAEVTS
jgi:hypothetical protein